MFDTSNLDPKLRFLVLYIDAKWSARRISETINTPIRTIQSWISKINEGKDVGIIEPGRGRKPIVSEEIKKKIVRTARRKPSHSSTRNLSSMYKVGRDTAYRTLKEKGMVYKTVKSQPALTEKHKKDRVDFCNSMLKRRVKPIDETFFSDEMGIKLSDAHPQKAWGEPSIKINVEAPRTDVKINCWGAISKKGATSLHIYTGNLESDLYKKVVKKHIPEMQEIYSNGFFVHDNLPLHLSVEGELKKQGLKFTKFPSYSPDLTPIENFWSTLKNKVYNDHPKTERQLVNSLKENWRELTEVQNLQPYFETLRGKYNQCIEEKGHRLPY